MTKVIQDELPWDDGGYTQDKAVLEALYFAAKKSRSIRRFKPDTSGLDLSQPLQGELLFDGSNTRANECDLPKGPIPGQPFGRKAWDAIPSVGSNNEIALTDPKTIIQSIGRLAAGLLYNQLDILMYSYGNAETKQEIIDWLFADEYTVFGCKAKKPMVKIPFTAQFCCSFEEVDLDLLREGIHVRLDKMREAQEARALKAQQRTGTQNEKINQGSVWN